MDNQKERTSWRVRSFYITGNVFPKSYVNFVSFELERACSVDILW